MNTLETLLPVVAGRAWRSLNELVASPDLLHSVREQMRTPVQEQALTHGNLPPSPSRGWAR